MSKLENKKPTREQWGGQTGFILAAIGSAIGLGNIWRFPGVAYENGGGAFLIPYLVALLTAGIPILLLEYSIGHRFRGSAPLSFKRISKPAEMLGWWQVGICFFVAIYYAVVIAWAVRYTMFSINLAWGDNASDFFFKQYLRAGEPGFSLEFVPGVLIPLIIVWALSLYVLALGIKKGLEKINYISLPILVGIFLLLVIRSLFLEGALDGVNAFFTPDWETLKNPMVWIAAYGHIFFSLSVAFGVMVTYSSYLKRKSDLTGSGLVVAFANSSFEILAGIGVFATLGFLAFQQNTGIGELEDIKGVGLAFVAFPSLISAMPGGTIFGILFFLCLTVAGFTSILSMIQGLAAAFQDKLGWSQKRSSLTFGTIIAIISITLFSTTSGLLILDVMDYYVNNIAIVLSAIVTMVLISLVYKKTPELKNHLNTVSSVKIGKGWQITITYIAPAILTVILISALREALTNGYKDYPGSFLNIFGWGSLAMILLISVTIRKIKYPDLVNKEFKPEDLKKLAKEIEEDKAKVTTQALATKHKTGENKK